MASTIRSSEGLGLDWVMCTTTGTTVGLDGKDSKPSGHPSLAWSFGIVRQMMC
jgi:membrane-associated phospholipid phosphatase